MWFHILWIWCCDDSTRTLHLPVRKRGCSGPGDLGVENGHFHIVERSVNTNSWEGSVGSQLGTNADRASDAVFGDQRTMMQNVCLTSPYESMFPHYEISLHKAPETRDEYEGMKINGIFDILMLAFTRKNTDALNPPDLQLWRTSVWTRQIIKRRSELHLNEITASCTDKGRGDHSLTPSRVAMGL